MRKINRILLLILLIVVLLIQNYYVMASSLNSSQIEFKVRFLGEPIVSNESKVKATITNDINATVDVTGLTMKENIETVTYIVQNTSKDLSAEISVNVSNNNKEYFLIDSEIEDITLTKGETTKVIIKIELLKEPVGESEKATIGIRLDAKPIQPEEDNSQEQNQNDSYLDSSYNDSVSSSTSNNLSITTTNKNYGYYEKDETPKTGFF